MLEACSAFNANDVLVHVSETNSKLCFCGQGLRFPIDDFPSGILRETKKIQQETGIHPLCLGVGILEHELDRDKWVHSPIVLVPLRFEVDKIRQEIRFQPIEEEAFINPFIQNKYALGASIETVHQRCISLGLTRIHAEKKVIGNFHHHRYQVLKELEDILSSDQISASLQSLLGFGSEENDPLEIPPHRLFPADPDHLSVFSSVESQNTVIQGPPGTGKTQVIANLIGKFLSSQQTTVVVSEKRVALEVLQKKLSHFGMDRLCYIAASNQLSRDFIQALEDTWHFFEHFQRIEAQTVLLSEQRIHHLQFTLDLLLKDDLIGGVSFYTFQQLVAENPIQKTHFQSKLVPIDYYLSQRENVSLLYEQKLSKSVGLLKHSTLKSEDLLTLDQRLDEWLRDLNLLASVFAFSTWNEFIWQMKTASDVQLFENEIVKQHLSFFEPESRAQKRFLKLRKKYLKAKQAVEVIGENQSHWKITPSEEETQSLLQSFEKKQGFFTRRKRAKRWEELSHLPISNAVSSLETHQNALEEKKKYAQVLLEFCELGILQPEVEVEQIAQSIPLFSKEKWKHFTQIAPEQRTAMTRLHQLINRIYHELNATFRWTNEDHPIDALTDLRTSLPGLLLHREKLTSLTDVLLEGIRRNKTEKEVFNELLFSHWVQFQERFPSFSQFTLDTVREKIEEIIALEKGEAEVFAQSILNRVHNEFKRYHDLLNTPAKKLNDSEKALKTRLRKGKSILVKEFAKTRRHPTLRELYHSEAREWIQLLKPIWLSNPMQLSNCFPMECNLFDVALFDEASQIPLEHALGTVFRSKRVIVAGDEHQMGPTHYFKKAQTESIDLLHQAKYNWKSVSLHHHYRSLHPDLIAFSNQHFYQNKLNAYPSFRPETPIRYHLVENAVFEQRRNQIEAEQVAQCLHSYLGLPETLGLVAFSEEQLLTIYNALTPRDQEILNERIENNTLFFKALENVQGDECDRLMISLAYAKNREGNFHLKFGPLNQSTGRNRLNVLLTRARKSIDFYCSVHAADFKLSSNESVNLLRSWLVFVEQYSSNASLSFPFGLTPRIEGDVLKFQRIYRVLPQAEELITLQRVLTQRGWCVQYD